MTKATKDGKNLKKNTKITFAQKYLKLGYSRIAKH